MTETTRNYGLVRSEEELTQFVDRILAHGKKFAFDIETGYTGPLRAKGSLQHYAPDNVIAGISFTNNSNWARYAAIHHDGADENLDELHVAREMWRLLRSGMGIAFNGLFELSRLSRFFRDLLWDDETWGEEVRKTDGIFTLYSDPMLASMLLGENKKKDLKTLSKEILGVDQVPLINLFHDRPELKGLNAAGKYVKYNQTNLRYNVLPLDADVVNYACEDSALTLDHDDRTYDQVKDLTIFKTEMLLTPILVQMEKEGLVLDWAEYERRSRDVTEFRELYAEYVMDQFSTITGELININLNSPAQVANVLFNVMKIKPTEYTDKNAPSTSEKAMRSLVAKHPEIRSLLEYREVAKLLGSYINKYLNELRYDPTGRAHPSHKQEGAGTGRFSVDGVSYQQWPKPYHYSLPSGKSLDLNYRNFLTSPENHRIVGFDYANVELRILAGLANETAMLEAFANGVDIHKQTASLMLGIPLEDVTDKDRSVGKTLNFAIVYGSGADNIASLITAATGELCTVERAEQYLEQYYEAFPDLKAWMDARVLEGRETHTVPFEGAAAHWVTTAFGRRIPIFEYESEFRSVRNKGDRNAVNGPVQGAAADYMKIAMVRVSRAIARAEETGVFPRGAAKLIMTVHDALEFYVRKDLDTETFISVIEPAISYPVTKDWEGNELIMPTIRADWHEGYRWGSVAEISRTEAGIEYSRKLELPDKSKHSFSSHSIDDLVAQIEAFWAERDSSELDARIIEELEFSVDDDEDISVFSPHSDNNDLVEFDSLPAKPSIDQESAEEPASTEEEVEPEQDDEPSWLHSPDFERTTLRLKLYAMPNTTNWPKFQEYIAKKAGSTTLILDLPDKEAALTFENVGIVPDDEVDIRLIFGEASLTVDRSSLDLSEALVGVEL